MKNTEIEERFKRVNQRLSSIELGFIGLSHPGNKCRSDQIFKEKTLEWINKCKKSEFVKAQEKLNDDFKWLNEAQEEIFEGVYPSKLTTSYLKEQHPELSDNQIQSLLNYCSF